jgi:hypothetical protein
MTFDSIVSDVEVHFQSIFPTIGVKKLRDFAHQDQLSDPTTDLSEYRYLRFSKNENTSFFIIDFDKPNAREIIMALPILPAWIIEGGELSGRKGHCQAGWLIHETESFIVKAYKKSFVLVYGGDVNDTDGLLRNPKCADANVTWIDTTVRMLDELLPLEVKDQAYDKAHGTRTERLRKASNSLLPYTPNSRTPETPQGRRGDFVGWLHDAKKGERNATLFLAIRQVVMKEYIDDVFEAVDIALQLNLLLKEPLPQYEVKATTRSIMKGKDEFRMAQSKRGIKSGIQRTFRADLDGYRRQLLHYEDGLSWKEVAAKEGMSLRAVMEANRRYNRRMEEKSIDKETGEILDTHVPS